MDVDATQGSECIWLWVLLYCCFSSSTVFLVPGEHLHIVLGLLQASSPQQPLMGQQSVVVDYTEEDEDWLVEKQRLPEQTDNNIIVRGISCIGLVSDTMQGHMASFMFAPRGI